MRPHPGILLGLMLLLSPGPRSAMAQEAPRPSSSSLILESAARGPLHYVALSDTTDSIPRQIRPTHWKEGALVGSLAFGAAIAMLFAVVCSAGAEAETDCSGAPIGGFLTGAVIGAFVGALIGGQFPKEEEAPKEASRRSSAT